LLRIGTGLTNGPGTPFVDIFSGEGVSPAEPCDPRVSPGGMGQTLLARFFVAPVYLRIRIWLNATLRLGGEVRPPDYEADEFIGWTIER
jgi:hypothetical protein